MRSRVGVLFTLTMAVITLAGCANVTTGTVYTKFDAMPSEVCIVRNPEVKINAAIPSLQAAFKRRGINTTIVESISDCKSEYRLNYVMRRSWDLTTYLGSGDLTLFKNNTIISTSNYSAGKATLTKWGKTKERIDKLVGKLLGEP